MAGQVAGLLVGCGGGKKSRRYELTPDDLVKHRHVLVVGAGPALVKLDVGMAGKLAMKGLNRLNRLLYCSRMMSKIIYHRNSITNSPELLSSFDPFEAGQSFNYSGLRDA